MPTEFIDPKFSEITVDVVRDVIETCIKEEKLPIKRLKSDYLLSCTLDNEFAQKVRDDYDKYLESI